MQHPITFNAEFLITGAYPDKNSFTDDNGKIVDYDRIVFYVQMPLSRGLGFSTVEYKALTSNDFERVFGSVQLPAVAQVVIEQTNNGKKTVQTIKDIVFKKINKI